MGRNFGNFGNSGGNHSNQGKHNPKGRKSPPPYNFIAPNECVFYPQDFGEVCDTQISFIKPFSDSQSGILEIKIIAKSDIFTGAFYGKDADNKSPKPFFKIGDSYALSGSSVRGVIRTISQVLSYAKFQTNAPDYEKKGEFVPRIKSNFDKHKSKLDMTERIFGAVSQGKSTQGITALKSRISFSHFIASKVCRAQYNNPTYISTTPEFAKSKTYKDKNGFRFYAPLGKITNPDEVKSNKNNDKMPFTISPLGKGTEFVGKLRYFNLTKAELGLLLLCLTALQSQKGEYYKFGGGKFYGYGDAQIEILNLSENLKNDCINAYKNLLSKADFALDTRINDLRNANKKQDTDSTGINSANTNKPSQTSTMRYLSPKKPQYDKFDKYRNNYADDDWSGL